MAGTGGGGTRSGCCRNLDCIDDDIFLGVLVPIAPIGVSRLIRSTEAFLTSTAPEGFTVRVDWKDPSLTSDWADFLVFSGTVLGE